MPEHDSPAPGWYDDPDRALHLRWWDGTKWTTHTRAKPVVAEPVPPTVPATTGATATTTMAEPTAAMPYGFSAPYSWSPSAPTPASVPPAPTVLDYAPERSLTFASWALAATPLITALSHLAAVALTGFESTPLFWVIGAGLIPILWLIIWVRRDRITLYEWGHVRRAHWGWVFLGALGYLTARAIVVHRSTWAGWWPLLVNLALSAALLSLGLFTPVLGVLRTIVF